MEYMLQFQHTGGRDRDFSENSRLAWFTEQISEQPRLHRKSLKNFGGGGGGGKRVFNYQGGFELAINYLPASAKDCKHTQPHPSKDQFHWVGGSDRPIPVHEKQH